MSTCYFKYQYVHYFLTAISVVSGQRNPDLLPFLNASSLQLSDLLERTREMTNRCYVQRRFKQRNTILRQYCSVSPLLSCDSICYADGRTTYGIRRPPNQLAFNAQYLYYFSSHQGAEGNTDRRGQIGRNPNTESTCELGHDCRPVVFHAPSQATNYCLIRDDRQGIYDSPRHINVTDIRPLPRRNTTPGSYLNTVPETQSDSADSVPTLPTANEHSATTRLPPIEVFLSPRSSCSANAIPLPAPSSHSMGPSISKYLPVSAWNGIHV